MPPAQVQDGECPQEPGQSGHHRPWADRTKAVPDEIVAEFTVLQEYRPRPTFRLPPIRQREFFHWGGYEEDVVGLRTQDLVKDPFRAPRVVMIGDDRDSSVRMERKKLLQGQGLIAGIGNAVFHDHDGLLAYSLSQQRQTHWVMVHVCKSRRGRHQDSVGQSTFIEPRRKQRPHVGITTEHHYVIGFARAAPYIKPLS